MRIDGILFDMDGVLLDSMPAHVDAWARAFGELGIHVDEEELYRREGEQGEVSAKYFIKASGVMSTRARVKKILELKEELFGKSPAIRLFPKAQETLDAVSATGLPMGLVTGTSLPEVERVFPETLRKHMKVIVTGDQVLHGKPHPEPYLKAAMALGVRPERTLVIENAPYGIQSAVKAGAICLAIRSYLPDADLAAAHYRIDQLKDLTGWLKENVDGF